MVSTGYQVPVGKIVGWGTPRVLHRNVESATSLVPGKLVEQGTSEYDVVVASGDAPPVGWLGYEDTNLSDRKEAITTAPVAAEEHSVLCGGGFEIYATLAIGPTALQGDDVYSWGAGCVVTGYELDGQKCVRVPFAKATSEADTGLDVPANVVIHWAAIEVVTAVASGTIDVGMGDGTESGYDADGLLDAALTSVAGINAQTMVHATAASITGSGALVEDTVIIDATGTPVYTPILKKPGLKCDGTLVSLSYTTSSHASTGYIMLAVSGPGIKKVGTACQAATASSSATQGLWVRSCL